MDKKEIAEKFNNFREVCLSNAMDLLKGAKASLDIKVDNACFHLTLLALEEIGKIELEAIKTMSKIHPPTEPIQYNFDIDDHERKIFWGLWGSSFGREKQTKELMDGKKGLAKNLHERRLLYLYSNPEDPQHWSELMGKDEAKMLYDYVEIRLKFEQSKSGLLERFVEEPDEDLIWFLKINEDEERRKEIWGHKSQDRLLELGDVKLWIKELRSVYEQHEKEMKELAEKEIQRQQPPEEKRADPKWRIRLEIVSPSHSIRQKKLKEFNDTVDWIKLSPSDAHTLKVELLLPKNVSIKSLWDRGWVMARMFITSLNIATNGFFWWNIKRDPSRYYEEIWDLENNVGVNIGLNPRLEMNWRDRRLILRPLDLSLTSIIFSYVAYCHGTAKENYINQYTNGLSLLAKNDVHLRIEVNTFDEFFKSLKTAMIENGDWDQKTNFEDAYQKATSWHFATVTEEMRKIFPLGFVVEKDHNGPVDLTSVYAMKNYCEVYLQALAFRYFKEVKGQDIKVVVGKDRGDTVETEL